MLYVPVNVLVMFGRFPVFLVETVLCKKIKCTAQGNHTMTPERLELEPSGPQCNALATE